MLSAITTSRSSLQQYLDKYPEVVKSLQHFTGINRANAFNVFNKTHFNAKTIGVDTSPYKFIIHREVNNKVNFYFDSALSFLMSTDVHEQLGLTLRDLLEMDYATFKIISNRLTEFELAKKNAVEDLTK